LVLVSYNRLLQVRGRKSGKLYSTPINLLEWKGKKFLVAPRGRTQWVRNAEASGEVVLKKGIKREKFSLVAVAESEQSEILKSYLDTFRREVQTYFPVAAGSPPAPLSGSPQYILCLNCCPPRRYF
jgi:deazaflavin-dependent oxidoreductase (nitroreductase family)